MSENLLIGVGGTGARIVESVIPLILSGIGPANVTIGFVDQDDANGNVRRAREFVRCYEAFRQRWTGANALDWTSPEGGIAFGRNALAPLSRDGDLWCPHPDKAATLLSVLEASMLSDDEKHMINLLFKPGKEEQEMPLGVGYRGHAHLGAAAMISRIVEGDAFWDVFKERIRKACAGEQVRIFLAGSVFGGTGAAGFPTIARVIRRLIDKEKENAPMNGQISIGGLLALPYFSFPAPKDSDGNLARSERLFTESRAALKYYHALFRDELVFNELYTLGWEPRFVLKHGSPGGLDQTNPALLPELIAATAAMRYFDPDRQTPPSEVKNKVFICGRNEPGAFKWSDLPVCAGQSRVEVYEKLGTLLRFCSVWRNMIRPSLQPKLWGRQPWFTRQSVNEVKFSDQQNENCLAAVDKLVDSVLVWAGMVATYAERGGIKDFALWNMGQLISFTEDDVKEPVKLAESSSKSGGLSDRDAMKIYDKMIIPWDKTHSPPDQAALFAEINQRRMPGNHSGLGRILAAAYHGARINSE